MMELGPEFWTKVDEMRLQQEQADAKLEALQAEAESAGADLQKGRKTDHSCIGVSMTCQFVALSNYS